MDHAEYYDLVGVFSVKDQALFKTANKPHPNIRLVSKFSDAADLWRFANILKGLFESVKESKDMPALAKAEVLSRLGDAYHKTMSAARKGTPEVNKLAVGMDVIKLLVDFIGLRFPQHGAAFVEVLEPFGQHLTSSLIQ